MSNNSPIVVRSIAEQNRILQLPKPLHPLISIFKLEDAMHQSEELGGKFVLDFYCVSLKKGFKGKFRYGQQYYDFDEGVMSFISPNQVLVNMSKEDYSLTGYCVSFHPDFIRNYPLGKKLKNYGFFSYEANEALHLSEQEEKMILQMFMDMEKEYQNSIDHFSQDIMVARLELLLSYSDRFYNRQFITRKPGNHDVLQRMEQLLADYFNNDTALRKGLPTVDFLATELNLSPGYLSDMLRSLTGQTAQQHIHNTLIEKAKELLAGTNLSVSEIAYQFGFEYPQSFNKLFKNKTNQTPLQYRAAFN